MASNDIVHVIDDQSENESTGIDDDDPLILLDVGRNLEFKVAQAGNDC